MCSCIAYCLVCLVKTQVTLTRLNVCSKNKLAFTCIHLLSFCEVYHCKDR
ncbi:hypothetical protein M758_UG224000 [Ceratodon purpureus]|nr:hypothetical protein M758_UG224000 [Ceratodon purpureus]